MIIQKQNDSSQNVSVYRQIERKQYVLVKYFESSVEYETSFDLYHQNAFNNNFAIKNKELYGGYNDEDAIKSYGKIIETTFTSEIVNFDTTKKEIKENHYQVTRSAKSLANQQILAANEKHSPEFESTLQDKENQLSKVRLTFNKDYLPTKLEWYYKPHTDNLTGKTYSLKWYTIRTFSYSYKNEKDFNKALDDAIDWIKVTEEEEASD